MFLNYFTHINEVIPLPPPINPLNELNNNLELLFMIIAVENFLVLNLVITSC
jgi:hypothetical protein